MLHQQARRDSVPHSLALKAEALLLWCADQNIIPGKLNKLADMLSRPRGIISMECPTLSHSALEQIWGYWFKPLIDLFATRLNFRLPVYVSPIPDPQAWAVDALTLPWTGLEALCPFLSWQKF